jgi:RNA polymerase sigma-70 factor (ECF subfamily)
MSQRAKFGVKGIMVGPTDHDAVSLLRRRDARGFELAYSRYAVALRSFLWRMTRSDEQADDLLQQTFLRLAERGCELRADSDLRAWLFTVARNAFYNYVRQLHRPDTDEQTLEALASPTPDIEARLLLRDVETALGLLKPDDRELLLLIGAEGLSYESVSRVLGVDQVALRQRLSRARCRLLAALNRLPEERTALSGRSTA